jgi:hypothetical protein
MNKTSRALLLLLSLATLGAVCVAAKDVLAAAPLCSTNAHPIDGDSAAGDNETASDDTSTCPPPEPPAPLTCELDEWDDLTETSQWLHARIGWYEDEWDEHLQVTNVKDLEFVFWSDVCEEFKTFLTNQGWTQESWNEQVHQRAGACQVRKWSELSEQSQAEYEKQGLTEDEWNSDRWIHTRDDADAILWEDICDSYREQLQARGWNEEAWNDDDGTKMTFYNEPELDWEELSEDRRQQFINDGFTESKYQRSMRNTEDGSHNDILAPAGKPFDPRVLSLAVPEVQALNFTHLATLDIEVGLVDSIPDEESESFVEIAPLGEYVKRIQAGEKHTYAQMEDNDRFTGKLWNPIGSKVMKYLGAAIESSELVTNGHYKREWMELDNDAYDWAMFLGGKGTKTAMHFDTDAFSFLYVVEGKKRVVMLENTGLVNETRFNVSSFFHGSAWTNLNILEPKNQPEGTVVMDVGPGQGVMIPHRAWHSVENLEHTIAYALRIM